LFTAPAHPQWGGAALVDAGGAGGIGSLLLQEAVGEGIGAAAICSFRSICSNPYSMTCSRTARRARAASWLGMYAQETEGRLIVAASPRAARPSVPGCRRAIWCWASRRAHLQPRRLFAQGLASGDPGVEVPLMLARQGDVLRLSVRSADRNDFLKKPRLH